MSGTLAVGLAAPSPQADVDEADERTTSMSGPTKPASPCPEVTPNTPMATASSKSLPAAVKASVVVLA